ncbi:MAG: organomercurial lyase [Halobacteriales archaeon]|nr:organomercurial lyase [Halobacteriales archaeon]
MSDSDPTPAYRGPEIPTSLGNQLQLALGLETRPAVFGDWVEAMAAIADRDDIELGPSTLCTVEDSPHTARFDGRTQHYQCVQDPIILPFLADDIDTVEIETESPVSGDPIKLTVTESAITADPDSVVMSFGVAEDVDGPPDDLPSPILAYSRFCPYGHPFPSHAEYETWAADVDAITMATSLEDTFELARALGRIAQ